MSLRVLVVVSLAALAACGGDSGSRRRPGPVADRRRLRGRHAGHRHPGPHGAPRRVGAAQPPRPAVGPERRRAALRGRAGRPDPHREERPAPGRRVPGRLLAHLERRRAGAARPRLPPAVRDQPPLLRQLHEPGRGHAHRGVPRDARPTPPTRASERVLLTVAQPFANHNGGGAGLRQLGPAADRTRRRRLGRRSAEQRPAPRHAARQDRPDRRRRGVAVLAARRQPVPRDGGGARRDLGLRAAQPVQDRRSTGPTGDLYIGDVGQNRIEEIDVGLTTRRGGENYGWRITEGTQCFNPASGCDRTGITPPVYEYTHSEGCSVTGGVVYRGCRVPALAGTLLLRRLLHRPGALVPLRERRRDRAAGLDLRDARRGRALLLRPRRRGRGVRRGLRRRAVPARAG